MSPFWKRKKREVTYEEFGKGEAYHLRTEIEGKELHIVAFHLPTDKKVDTKFKAEVSAERAGVEGGRNRQSKGSWEAIIMTSEYGYLPLDTWKRMKEQVADELANTLSTATGSSIRSSDVEIIHAGIVPCPKCQNLVPLDCGKCPKCGQLIPYYY